MNNLQGLRNRLWHLDHLGTTCTLMDALIDSSLDEASQCRHPAPCSLGGFLNLTGANTTCKAFDITCGIHVPELLGLVSCKGSERGRYPILHLLCIFEPDGSPVPSPPGPFDTSFVKNCRCRAPAFWNSRGHCLSSDPSWPHQKQVGQGCGTLWLECFGGGLTYL